MRNWLILIKERFSPGSYLPMILIFTFANSLYVARTINYTYDDFRFVWVLLIMLSFFFRMRCFDEIKDYEVDLKINPTRPLARGVLTIRQVKKGLIAMILFELILSAFLGIWPFLIHITAIFYSLMMYEEFFIGDFLRPHLTTYAVSHTFVSTLLGLSAATAVVGLNPQKLQFNDIMFFFSNWCFFNLFEFARKTFAASEERPGVASYSNIFKPFGAWLLSWSQVIVGIILCWVALSRYPRFYWVVAGGVIYTLLSVGYALNPQEKMAKIFRAGTGVYLLLHYILVCFVLMGV